MPYITHLDTSAILLSHKPLHAHTHVAHTDTHTRYTHTQTLIDTSNIRLRRYYSRTHTHTHTLDTDDITLAQTHTTGRTLGLILERFLKCLL